MKTIKVLLLTLSIGFLSTQTMADSSWSEKEKQTMKELAMDELREVEAQYKRDDINKMEMIEKGLDIALPVFMALNYDLKIESVEWPSREASATENGAIEVPLPSRIKTLNMENIRVNKDEQSMGNLRFDNITFSDDSRLMIQYR